MSVSFDIASSSGKYEISIGSGLLDSVFSKAAAAIVICDQYFETNLKTRHLPLVSVHATEQAKSLDRLSQIILQLRQAGANRESTIVAIGGGVIQDIATFCASLYMRGVPWIYLPTTLLGMVDSCIGGKSSINVGSYKNLVGNYYPPQQIIIDPTYIDSLSTEQRIAGLCEAAKICFAHDDDSFERYLAMQPGPDMPVEKYSSVIEISLRAKKWFIETDEFDRNERLLLNFGHTFGHAIEGATEFAVTHGVAVGLGMLVAADFTSRLQSVPVMHERTHRLIRHVTELLAGVEGLSAVLSRVRIDLVMDRFSSDKKHGSHYFTAIVPNKPGRLERIRLPRQAETLQVIGEAFDSVFSSWPAEPGKVA